MMFMYLSLHSDFNFFFLCFFPPSPGLGVILAGVGIAVAWGYRRYKRGKKAREAEASLGREGGAAGPGGAPMVTAAGAGGPAGAPMSGIFIGADEQKHHGSACRKCGMKPIRGIRFSCSTCDFDMCQACYLRFAASHGVRDGGCVFFFFFLKKRLFFKIFFIDPSSRESLVSTILSLSFLFFLSQDPAKVAHTFMKFERAFTPQDRSISDLNFSALRKVLDALAHPRVTSLLDFLPLTNFQWQAASRSGACAVG
jgi:hypothetical protein